MRTAMLMESTGLISQLMRLVLASRSPRRRELLALTGLPFEMLAAQTEEVRQPGESPSAYACRLSQDKAQAVVALLDHPALVLAADTIVADGDDVLGKPRDAAEAVAMLRRLRGHSHMVYTGVTVYNMASGRTVTQAAASPVLMRGYTDEEVALYVASGDPFDKAGAYGIQHHDFNPAGDFAHCFANVMGLPLCHITRMLRTLAAASLTAVPAACQEYLAYACPVYESLLAGEDQPT